MAFMVSPGVSVAEIDLTTRVPIPSTSVGAHAGLFKWGPVEEIVSVVDSDDLKMKFGKTDLNTYDYFLTCSSFLSYSNNLKVVRASNTTVSLNSSTNGNGFLIKNVKDYEQNYPNGLTGSDRNFVAKYPGELGDSLRTSICLPDRANTTATAEGTVTLSANVQIELTGTFSAQQNSNTFTGSQSSVSSQLCVGDVVEIFNGTKGIVTSVANTTSFDAVRYDTTVSGNQTINLFGASSVDAGNTVIRHSRSAFEESSDNMFGTLDIPAGSKVVTGSYTFFRYQLNVGDILTFTDSTNQSVRRRVDSIESDLALTLSEPVDRLVSSSTYSREWEYRSSFDNPPLTSAFALKTTGNKDTLDEIHVIVVDEDGEITGIPDRRGRGTTKTSVSVLERYSNLSVAKNALSTTDGTSIYYPDVISNKSAWVWFGGHDNIGDERSIDGVTLSLDWGTTLQNSTTLPFNGFHNSSVTNFAQGTVSESLGGGVDGNDVIGSGEIMNAYNMFRNPEDVDISLIIPGQVPDEIAVYIINEICEYRKDCVAFVSPRYEDFVTTGQETANIVARRKNLPSSSYAVMDGNYKYMFDRFSGVFRYIPLNGDVAGICAQADTINPYVSPAGFNRGNVKNVTKLAFNPTNADRDLLYANGINPVISLPGGGTILFGDKTLLARPSAFDRINVRRLFIILEKAIANAAQFSLFEFNDAFTRASFVSLVEPFLREVKSRRGISDYKVVCDATNNPPNVVDRNEFRGDIFIKPSRSINFINLNFVAVATGVQFNEVINAI